jgi:hypothetical protein
LLTDSEVDSKSVDLLDRQKADRLIRASPQDGLRQRGSVVGQVSLGSDKREFAVEAAVAQRLRGASAGERCADDYHSSRRGP